MRPRVALIYNEPVPGRYQNTGEEKAVLGVMDSVNAVKKALVELRYEVTIVPLELPVEQAYEKLNNLSTDIVFNLFEGFPGFPETETLIPKYLSNKGIVFTGCSSEALKLGLDKTKTKEILLKAGIPTPAFQILSPDNIAAFNLKYPCIVKPFAEDASHGLTEDSIVNDANGLTRQVNILSSNYGGQALVEEFVKGREFNATVLGNIEHIIFPVSEITFNLPPDKPEILTFDAKWEKNSIYYKNTPVVCPAKIDDTEKERISKIALAAFKAIIGRGYARVDMRLDNQNRVNVIEVNPNPDISPDTGAARQAKAAGLNYAQFIEKIIILAMEKGKV
ncbi:MAG: ATP-grasp domain-containing protein [Dehalococcoidales bacterium]|nr:ATP-grasp domain-containing protein [Dehalococcoidales bacterium]